MRIVQISDTHISALGGVTTANFAILADFVNSALRPDLVVNTGDVSILSPDIPEDREVAQELHKQFDAPVRVLPGNHDLGEAGENPWQGIAVTSERVKGFKASFGSDRFVELCEDGWAIVGMNSEILSSGLPEEHEQWGWLDDVAEQVQGRSVVLFLHKPLWSPVPGYTEHALAIEEADRERLLALFSKARLRAVGSGHLHCFKSSWEGDVRTVWAPSSAFVMRSKDFNFGLNQLGVVEYQIDGDELEVYFRSVPTLTENEPFDMAEFAQTMKIIEAAAAV